MTEEFLQFLWGNRLCYQVGLRTKDGQDMEIIHPGLPNNDAGPDFFNAKIKIGKTLWAGNVEIHIREKDWNAHGHQNDPVYNNVILHVVQEAGGVTVNSKGEGLPVWEMKYDDTLLYNYNSLLQRSSFVACERYFDNIPRIEVAQWLERVLVEKIESKSDDIERYLEFTNNDWNEVFYILLARSFGFGVNGDPFELLARQTPFRILLKHADDLSRIEALIFGQAGFLDNKKVKDKYIAELRREYEFLSYKYGLKSIDVHLWRFLRLRPANFPTIRIAQLAGLIHKYHGQFDAVINNPELKRMEEMLRIGVSEYWQEHYKPGKLSGKATLKMLGQNSVRRIIANSIVPYVYMYARKKSDTVLQEKALDVLSQLPPENNSIVHHWTEKLYAAKDEAQAQALIFLKKHYCNHKKCLSCHIGQKVIVKKF